MKPVFTFTQFLTLLIALLVSNGCSKPEEPAPPPTTQPQQPTPPPAPTPLATPTQPAIDESKPVLLQQQWNAHTRYHQRVDMTQLSYTYASSLPHALEQRIQTRQNYSVDVQQPNPIAKLKVRINEFAIKMGQSGTDLIDFDSEKTARPNDPAIGIYKSLEQLVGKELTFTTTTNNTVDQVEGIDELRTQVLKDAPPQAQVILAGMLTSDSLKNMVDLSRGLPNKPASTGDAWPLQIEMSLGPMGTAIVTGTNTFSRWETKNNKRCALITYNAKITRQPDNKPPVGPNDPSKEMHNGMLSGQGWFDPAQGALVESVTEQSMTMVLDFPVPEGAQGSRTVTNIVATTISLKLLSTENIPAPSPNP